ncbi:DUF3857 domain-containing protein [Winogradskyella luteola]|uniref:DUF3857 domain-containing protein n=1 Tax=Winogradskyella luteola TaxID=2828330 RepID=A0A9X1F8V2_9FLAO|nr:DUF3857 domain-containing protein [Winogradskyella luteola]MBV7269479.1 DUF3857 domain-containing protein [Winogradskyella luteola]
MPHKKPILSIFLILIAYCSFSQEESLYDSSTIPPELMTKANAVVRFNDVLIEIESNDRMKITEKRIVTVLNEQGNLATQAYSGYDRYNKIKKIGARIFNAEGEEIKKIKRRDFIDHSAVDGGTLYSDSRVVAMAYDPVSYPYTVEFICETETSNTAAIPTWRPLTSYYVSVQKDSYRLVDKASLGLRYKEKNLDELELKKSNTASSLQYLLQNAKPLAPESLSPSLYKMIPQVMVAVESFSFYGVEGKAKNWKEFGDWVYNALLSGRNEITEETKQEVLDMTSNIEDPVEKAKQIFEYVQNNTRYISVQVGIGGVQPIPALEVDELKYGDCKGLTNYTQSLLEVAGVESYYSIVEAGTDPIDLEDDFASLEQGNHIILAIPHEDDMLWLDCTSQIHPFNFIGDFTDNRNVLIVKPDSSEIVKTTIYPDSLNYQLTQADIKFDSYGGIIAHVTRKTEGLRYDNRFSIERQSDKDVINFYKKNWGYINDLMVDKYKFHNDKTHIEFTETLDVSAQNYTTQTGDRILFKPNALNQNTYVPNRYRNRKSPVDITRGYLDEDVFIFVIPKNYEIEAMPDNVEIKNKFGEYSFTVRQEEGKLIYKRKLLIKKGEYPKTDYEDYRSFRKKVSKNDNSKIVLKAIN